MQGPNEVDREIKGCCEKLNNERLESALYSADMRFVVNVTV